MGEIYDAAFDIETNDLCKPNKLLSICPPSSTPAANRNASAAAITLAMTGRSRTAWRCCSAPKG